MAQRILLIVVYVLLTIFCGCSSTGKIALTITEMPCGNYSYTMEFEKNDN